jgi:hypothetical protein
MSDHARFFIWLPNGKLANRQMILAYLSEPRVQVSIVAPVPAHVREHWDASVLAGDYTPLVWIWDDQQGQPRRVGTISPMAGVAAKSRRSVFPFFGDYQFHSVMPTGDVILKAVQLETENERAQPTGTPAVAPSGGDPPTNKKESRAIAYALVKGIPHAVSEKLVRDQLIAFDCLSGTGSPDGTRRRSLRDELKGQFETPPIPTTSAGQPPVHFFADRALLDLGDAPSKVEVDGKRVGVPVYWVCDIFGGSARVSPQELWSAIRSGKAGLWKWEAENNWYKTEVLPLTKQIQAMGEPK